MNERAIPMIVTCKRCGRVTPSQNPDGDWNVVINLGVYVGAVCPACQTPEENAEAVINEATVDYSKTQVVDMSDMPEDERARLILTTIWKRTEETIRQMVREGRERGDTDVATEAIIERTYDSLPDAWTSGNELVVLETITEHVVWIVEQNREKE